MKQAGLFYLLFFLGWIVFIWGDVSLLACIECMEVSPTTAFIPIGGFIILGSFGFYDFKKKIGGLENETIRKIRS